MTKSRDLKIFSDEELNVRNEGLSLIHEGMCELEIDFFLMMGVLLGAVREKDFIRWDWDVELGFFTESIINRVSEIERVFESKQFKVELIDSTYENFKINLFYGSNKYTLWGLHYSGNFLQRKDYKFPKKYFSTFDKIYFKGIVYKTPNNTKDLLGYIYGDWKIPKKTNIKSEYLQKDIFINEVFFKKLINKIKFIFSKY
jgi:phosphorylcholine metabolism protein LicD